MVVTKSEYPKNRGEKEFARRLDQLLPSDASVWYGINLTGVPEIDTFLMVPAMEHPYLIEVKSKPINLIQEFTLTSCKFADQRYAQHPVRQANKASFPLRQKFLDKFGKEPWIISTAAFPNILRSEFIKKFGNEGKFVGLLDQADSMIFKEDLSDSDRFLQRLKHISLFPPYGKSPSKNQIEYSDVEDMAAKLFGSVEVFPEPRIKQFKIGARGARKDSVRKFTVPGNRGAVVIDGFPGTGKTQALIDVLVNHAGSGRKCLYLTFNNTLAASIRSEIEYSEKIPEEIKNKIIVAGIYQLRQQLRDPAFRTSFREVFETVCIDESQDLFQYDKYGGKNWDISEPLKFMFSPNAEIFYAYGEGQQLYGATPKVIQEVISKKDPETYVRLRRNAGADDTGYRDSTFAQSLFETAKDSNDSYTAEDRVKYAVKKFFKISLGKYTMSDPELLSIVSNGSQKKILTKPLNAYLRFNYTNETFFVSELRQAIAEELIYLASLGKDNDLMIVIPSYGEGKKYWYQVIQVLKEMQIAYVDYFTKDNRKATRPAKAVVVTTAHSSRGLEAERVLLILPNLFRVTLPKSSPNYEAASTALTKTAPFIALSRSLGGTRVIMDVQAKENSEFQEFLLKFTQTLTEVQLNLIRGEMDKVCEMLEIKK